MKELVNFFMSLVNLRMYWSDKAFQCWTFHSRKKSVAFTPQETKHIKKNQLGPRRRELWT